MEPHAPKGQRTLFDEGCTKQKRLSNEQSRELRICLESDIARRLEEHERAAFSGHSSPGLWQTQGQGVKG